MEYRRDYKIKNKHKKRTTLKYKRYAPVYTLVGGIGALCLAVGLYFGTDIFSDPGVEIIAMAPDSSQYRKEVVLAENSISQQLEEQEQNTGSTSSGITDFTNGTLNAKDHGVLITDSRNPSGLPLYDGWTMSVTELKAKAESKGLPSDYIKSWDLDYSQFWKDDKFKDNPGLYGLGDFTNSKAGSKNMISGGSTTGYFKGHTQQISSGVGTVSTYDGRVLFAVPGRVFTDPSLLTDDVLKALSGNCGLTRTSPEGSTRVYTDCYKVTYNGYENMIHDWSNCVPNNNNWRGLYFDILFDDGTVLAAIMADGKGVHVGGDARGSWCEDTLMSGYGQVRFKRQDPQQVGYQSCLEIYSPGFKNNGLDIQLSTKKIVGIRTYNVSGSPSKGAYTKWFTE